MTMVEFLIIDKLGKIGFFEETFLLADTNTKVVLEMLFFLLSHIDIKFEKKIGELI